VTRRTVYPLGYGARDIGVIDGEGVAVVIVRD